MATQIDADEPIAFGEGIHGTRTQAMQRLKVGVGGLFAMLLLVGFASTIIEQSRDATTPAETAAATGDQAQPNKDPLVDIGVAPELPVEDVVVPDLPPDQMVPAEDAANGPSTPQQ